LEHEFIYRKYTLSDYQSCENLVNQAWDFDAIFSSKELSSFAKFIYTQGSVVGSNYQYVVEKDKKVVALLFGLNENLKKPKLNILFRLKILWKYQFMKNQATEKEDLIKALITHGKNKEKIVNKNRSEIVLFVVDKNYQGVGLGQNLWSGFKKSCKQSNVKSIVVETNTLGASSYYEHIGFNHHQNLDSPLHEFATYGGQACIYEYTLN